MLQYEHEIQYIIQEKDRHYDIMMRAKDAKIMNLIEGTDFQALLIKHELDIEQLKRIHADEIDKVRVATENQQREAFSSLEETIAKGVAGQEKLKKDITLLQRDLDKAYELNKAKDEQMATREAEHDADMKRVQRQVEHVYNQMDQLIEKGHASSCYCSFKNSDEW